MTKKILVLGSIAYDHIMDFDENFLNAVSIDHDEKKYQSMITASSRITQFGGTAGNISYHIGKLDGMCDMYGSVGKDFISLGYKEHFDKLDNVTPILDIHEELYTAACFIVNDNAKNQMITFHGGALNENVNLSLKEKIKNPSEYFFAINSVQSVPAMIHFANELYELEIPFIFDPGQVIPIFPPEDLKNVINMAEVLICNDAEFELILQKTGYSTEEIREKVPVIIITKGEKGSTLYHRDQNLECEIPICKVETVVDPTGAGDGYRSGFLTGLSKGMSFEDSCKLGAVIGSFIVQSMGGQSQQYSIEDVKRVFKETFGYIPKELE